MNRFPDIFFDINTNDDVKNILAQASELFSTLIYELGEVSNELNYSVGVSNDDSYLHLVITLFVRKLMEQIDAINILYSYGLVTVAELVLRSMLETIVTLKFILLKDETNRDETRFRAAAYFFGRHYQDMAIAEKKTAINNMVQRNSFFKRVDDERNKLKKPEKSAWYKVVGVHNFKEMMETVGMDEYYEGVYGPLSLETHALNVTMAMNVKDDVVYPDRIRSPHNGENTFGLTCTFASIALQELYKYLGDEDKERLEFAKFYKKRDIVETKLRKIVH